MVGWWWEWLVVVRSLILLPRYYIATEFKGLAKEKKKREMSIGWLITSSRK